jgi:hypothetical protein
MIRRMLVAVVVAAAGLVPLFAVSPASAIPLCNTDYTCLYVYYSTSAHTTEIGYLNVPCSGTPTSWGTVSGWFTFSEKECNS